MIKVLLLIASMLVSPGYVQDFNIAGPISAYNDLEVYPYGWPDTAKQRGYAVNGIYDPKTIWISDGQLHIRMYRDNVNHVAAVVPKSGKRLYGVFSERFRVSHIEPGYKSAHLLWPINKCVCEIDFPESEYTSTIHAFTHTDHQDSFDTGARWSDWHISRIEWRPGSVKYFLDNRLIGESRVNIDELMMWVLQNESALEGPSARSGSYVQIDIDWISVNV